MEWDEIEILPDPPKLLRMNREALRCSILRALSKMPGNENFTDEQIADAILKGLGV